jgi:hypothetical protein
MDMGLPTWGRRRIRRESSAIIRFFASYLLSVVSCGVPRLKKALGGFLCLLLGCTALTSCGSKKASNSTHVPSGLKFRAFISNPLSVNSAGSSLPALNIVDASKDLISGFTVDLSTSVSNAGMMALSPSQAFTLVSSPSNNSVAIVNNTTETAQGVVNLPGATQSMFVWIDNATAYAAVPGATVTASQGQSPGAVVALDLANSAISATLPVPGAQYVVDSHDGSRILAFGNIPQNVTVINPSQVSTATDPRTVVSSMAFDHPVWGVFSADDTTAYILNCGPECGGTASSVAVLDMTQNPPVVTATILVPAATFGILNGSTLYVAGTASGGGQLTAISVATNTVLNASAIAISDGYHNRMALTGNGELLIGARTCTGGCLSFFNTATGAVAVPAVSGDVTGMQPITGRNVAYVCQGGFLNIYDTTKNVLQKTQVNIVGQPEDVELVGSP